MSVVAAAVRSKRAVIIADTATSEADGSNPGHASKLFAFPHAGSVLAARGLMPYCSAVASALNWTQRPDFEGIRDSLPAAIVAIRDTIAHQCADPQSEFLLVGWSEARGTMAAHHFRIEHGDITGGECGGVLYLPGDTRWRLDMEAGTPGRLLAMARVQLQHLRAIAPERGAGGCFTVAELTRDAVTIRRIPE